MKNVILMVAILAMSATAFCKTIQKRICGKVSAISFHERTKTSAKYYGIDWSASSSGYSPDFKTIDLQNKALTLAQTAMLSDNLELCFTIEGEEIPGEQFGGPVVEATLIKH